LSPNLNASPNKICALFKTAIWNSKPILLQKSFESKTQKIVDINRSWRFDIPSSFFVLCAFEIVARVY